MDEEPVYEVRFSLSLTERHWFFVVLGLSVSLVVLVFFQAAALTFSIFTISGHTYFSIVTVLVCVVFILLALWKCRSIFKIVKRNGCTQPAQLVRTRGELLKLLRSMANTLMYLSGGHKLVVDFSFLLQIDAEGCMYDKTTQFIMIGFIICHGVFVAIANILEHRVFDGDVVPSFAAPSTTANSMPRTRTMSSVYTYPQGDEPRYLKPSTIGTGTIRSVSLPPAPSQPAPTPSDDPDIVELSLDKFV